MWRLQGIQQHFFQILSPLLYLFSMIASHVIFYKSPHKHGSSQEDLGSAKLLVWSDIDWARKAWN